MSQSSVGRAQAGTSQLHSTTSTSVTAEIEEALNDQEHDPDLLMKLQPGKYGDVRWTIGNSDDLVPGRTKESPLVSSAWVIIPLLLAAAVLYGMTQLS